MCCADPANEVPKCSELQQGPSDFGITVVHLSDVHARETKKLFEHMTPALRRKVFHAGEVDTIALLRLGVQLLPKRIDRSWIVCAYPEISIPSDRANLCWARSIVLFERSELLSVPRRNEKFHRKGLSVSYRIDGHMRERFSGQSMSVRSHT